MKLDKILNGLKTLTSREDEVLNQIISGRLNKEIASELGITIRTVKEHRRHIMEKMEANSLAELVTMIVTARINETRMITQATPIAAKTKPHESSGSKACSVKEMRARLGTLTPREFDVLKLVIGGMLNKQTAARLGTTERTIKVHRGRVMEKMGVKSVAELVILAHRAGVASKSADSTKV